LHSFFSTAVAVVTSNCFELWSLAVSAINGSGINTHEKALNEAGVASASIQTAVRFAAAIQSVAIAIEAGAIELAAAAE